jgi:NTE family protein
MPADKGCALIAVMPGWTKGHCEFVPTAMSDRAVDLGGLSCLHSGTAQADGAGADARFDADFQAEASIKTFADHIESLIRTSGAFAGADNDCLRSIAEAATWLSIRGGEVLFSQGDPSDAMYIVINGFLAANVRKSTGEESIVERIGPGEVIGEMGAVVGEPRSATLRASRSSELIALSREAFDELARRYPALMRGLYGTVVKRLRNVQEGRSTPYRPRTFCIVPSIGDDGASTFAHQLADELSTFGSTFLVTKSALGDSTSDRFAALEAAHDYVVYLAERRRTSWSRLCLGQADTILVVAHGANAPNCIAALSDRVSAHIPIELVLLWSAGIMQGKATAWLDLLQADGHFHVRSHADLSRAARLLTGRGLGLVLSGGGARGLSHLGVSRALADHGVSADVICGTSIGALIGAALALETPFEAVRERMHAFSRKHPLRELVLPCSSLLSGRQLRLAAERWFGELAIEDMPIRFACVTSNLTTSSVAAHCRGKLKTWVCASSSLPGIFPPVFADGALHVDGGVLNNLPTDIIRQMGAGCVVAVDVGLRPASVCADPAAPKRRLPNILDLLIRVATMSDAARGFAACEQCDVLLLPNVQHLGLLHWRVYDEAIRCGYDCAVAQIDKIKNRANVPLPASALSSSQCQVRYQGH